MACWMSFLPAGVDTKHGLPSLVLPYLINPLSSKRWYSLFQYLSSSVFGRFRNWVFIFIFAFFAGGGVWSPNRCNSSETFGDSIPQETNYHSPSCTHNAEQRQNSWRGKTLGPKGQVWDRSWTNHNHPMDLLFSGESPWMQLFRTCHSKSVSQFHLQSYRTW